MPRKFRLAVPVKNGPRKLRNRSVVTAHLPLSVEALQLANPTFSISIPIKFIWDLKATSLSVLKKRLKEMSALTQGTFYACI